MAVTLRPAGAADAPRVAALLIDTRAAFMAYAPLAHTAAELQDWVACELLPSGGVLVAQDSDGRVVGMTALADAADGGWVDQMAVDPARVGQGIGSQLLAHALRSLRRPVRLYVFQANAGARRFYERHGFVAVACSDGQANEERCPDVLYECRTVPVPRP